MKAILIIPMLLLCQYILAQYPAFNGGANDGNATYTLSASSAFNIYKGGSNDGTAYAYKQAEGSFNIYNGGANDGFAHHVFNVETAFNIYKGGTGDGFAFNTLNSTTAFNLYNGGINDGIGYAQLTSTLAFNFYKGGANDGFAYGSTITPPITVDSCGNVINLSTTQLTNITKHSATFTWTKYNSGATSYFIQLKSGGINGPVIRNISQVYGSDTTVSVNFTGLAAGGYYCFNLQEYCPSGASTAPSAHYCFNTAPDDCPTPTIPQHLSNTGSSVSLGWNPGVTTGGVSNYNYEIELTPIGSSATYNYGGTISGTPISRTITCLPTGTFFNFKIREQCGVNKYSEYITGTTYTSPGCAAPTDLATTVTNTQNARLSWSSSYYDQADRPYQLSYGVGITSPGAGTYSPVTVIQPANVSGSVRSHNFYAEEGIGNVVWYVREICGMCDTTAWAGPYTIPVIPCTAPSGSGMNATSVTTTTAVLNWVSVNNNTGALLELRNQSTGTSVYYNAPTDTGYHFSQTVSSLTMATTYNWRIKQYCPSGDSTTYTAWSEFATSGGSTCAAPTGLGVKFTSGAYLMTMWYSIHYPNTCCAPNGFKYQVAFGDNITSPGQGTIRNQNYFFTQYAEHASLPFVDGNHPGFTFYVRDICGPGDTSVWVGPYVVGSSKTDETTTGIVETEINKQLQLDMYPNPNNGDELNVNVEGWGERVQMEVYNLQGSLVWQQNMAGYGSNKVRLDLPNATYICRFTAGEHTQTERLVIQR